MTVHPRPFLPEIIPWPAKPEIAEMHPFTAEHLTLDNPEEDFDQLIDVVNTCYRSKESWTTEHHLVTGKRLTKQLLLDTINDYHVLIIKKDGRVSACIQYGTYTPETPEERERIAQGDGASSGYFGMLSVHPSIQSLGFGSMLVKLAEQQCKRLYNATKMTIVVMEVRDDILAWYVKLGFRKVATLTSARKFFENWGETILTEEDFDFIVMEKNL